MLSITSSIRKVNLLKSSNSVPIYNVIIASSRSFSSSSDNDSAHKGMFKMSLSNLSSVRSKVIYGLGGAATFYLFTKGFYNVTYDLLASSPASMLKYGFYGGVASSSLFHLCSYYFARFIYMSPEHVFTSAMSRIKKNDTVDSIFGSKISADRFKSYSFEAGGISIFQGIYVRPKMKMTFNVTSNNNSGIVKVSCSQNGTTLIFDYISILYGGKHILIEGNDTSESFKNFKFPQTMK